MGGGSGVASGIARGERRMYELAPPHKKRPVLVLTRGPQTLWRRIGSDDLGGDMSSQTFLHAVLRAMFPKLRPLPWSLGGGGRVGS